MDTKLKKVIERIIDIPRDFRRRKNISPINLTKESGYLEHHEKISESEIIEILKGNPQSIAEWVLWSENKRSTSTWLFTRDEEDGWCFVGHSPESKEFEEINTKDEFFACAAFIKREVESIRKTFYD